MRSRLKELMLGALIASSLPSGTPSPAIKRELPEHGLWRRSHNKNVKRKRLRRIAAKSRSINRSKQS